MQGPGLARRYVRQSRLAEVGEAGQAKLCAAEVALGSTGFARLVEERYLRGAGLRIIDRAGVDPAVTPESSAGIGEPLEALELRHEGPREVAEGALRALAAISRALEGERP